MSSNRGRPRKEASKRLEERICVRLKREDKEALTKVAEAKGVTPTEYAHDHIVRGLYKTVQELEKEGFHPPSV
jgi:uncharacterized protein (DUF1778 family)